MLASTKWLVGLVAVVFLIPLPLAFGYRYPLVFAYEWHKALHILGAVIFLGNIIVTGVWMLRAERTRDPSVLRFAAEAVNWADVLFTGPGVILVLWNGLTLAEQLGGIYRTSWITVALGLFLLSGIVWVVFLLPYQHELIHRSGEPFFRVLHKWYVWGTVATILPLISLALMVVKPRFW